MLFLRWWQPIVKLLFCLLSFAPAVVGGGGEQPAVAALVGNEVGEKVLYSTRNNAFRPSVVNPRLPGDVVCQLRAPKLCAPPRRRFLWKAKAASIACVAFSVFVSE